MQVYERKRKRPSLFTSQQNMQVYERKRKRKRSLNFVVGDKVEVRREDEGLKGSWHAGTVVELSDNLMRVRYDYLLIDDGDLAFDGSVDELDTRKHYRGTIRPMKIDLDTVSGLDLSYGMCVDVYFSDAWWEGVILDDGDGCDERLVFFPDLGSQRRIRFEKVRVSRDWNEATGCWSPRGRWLFLELIEEKKEGLSVDLSVERIWYFAKDKVEFGKSIVDWTCSSRLMWDGLVTEVIGEMYPTAENHSEWDGLVTEVIGEMYPTAENHSEWDGLVTEVIGEMYPTAENHSDVNRLQNGVRLPSEDIQGFDDISTNVEEHCGNIASDHTENLDLDLKLSYKAVECELATKSVAIDSSLISFEAPCSVADTTNECMNIDDQCEMYPSIQNDSDVSDLHNGDHLSSEKIQGLKDISTNVEDHCGNIAANQTGNPVLESIPNSNNYKAVECELATKSHTTSSNSVSFEVPTSVSNTTNECMGVDDPNYNKIHDNHSTLTENETWQPALGTEMLPSAECCLDALLNYLQTNRFNKNMKENNDDATLVSVRKHLSYMGWRVEFKQDKVETKSTTLFRYIAPDGVIIDSPLQACWHFFEVIKTLMNKRPNTSQHSSGVVQDKLNRNEQGVQEVIHDTYSNPPVLDIRDSETRKQRLGVVPDKLNQKVQGVQDVINNSFGNPPKSDICNTGLENVCGYSSLCVEARGSYVPESDSPSKKREVLLEPEYCPEAVIKWIEVSANGRNQGMSESAQKHLLAIDWKLWYITKKGGKQELRYTSPGGKTYISLRTACIACVDENLLYGKTNGANDLIHSSVTKKKERFQFGEGEVRGAKRCREMQIQCETHLMRSPKRGRHIVEPSPVEYTPKTVLSCLIENNVISMGTKVFCMGVDGRDDMVKGIICREGIKCKCCDKVFSPTKFEVHVGGISHTSARNIILEGGRSLLLCQETIANSIKSKYFSAESQKRINRKQMYEKSDSKCSVCCYGGELVLCDQCPSAFHLGCLGLGIKDLPEGHWFCPCCRCGICNQSDFDWDYQQYTEKTALCCDQCEREYHFGCIRQKRLVKLENFLQGNWFCSEKCEQIFMDLHKLLGKPITVGNNSLTLTMLKFSNNDYLDEATTIEHYCKLNVALSVMHECFEPIKETHTKKDLIEDIIFNKRSDLNRLNFSGFYTVLLERDDEIISVATVRIYGANVAEIPLVGTRFQYRRKGMCHILLDVLEKKLAELGVERLVLPAIPQTLHTWTNSFGFSKMITTERLKFLQYTFLDFPDTIMCQKVMRKAPEPFQPTGNCNQLEDEIDLNDTLADLFSEEIEAVNSQLNFLEPIPDEMSFQL